MVIRKEVKGNLYLCFVDILARQVEYHVQINDVQIAGRITGTYVIRVTAETTFYVTYLI